MRVGLADAAAQRQPFGQLPGGVCRNLQQDDLRRHPVDLGQNVPRPVHRIDREIAVLAQRPSEGVGKQCVLRIDDHGAKSFHLPFSRHMLYILQVKFKFLLPGQIISAVYLCKPC